MCIELITNPLLVNPLLAAAISQCIKSIIEWSRHGEFHWRYLFISAGMPSSHTAAVTALSFTVFFVEGATNLFAVTCVFSAVVIRDVLGDKAFAQTQEKLVNDTIANLFKKKFTLIEWDEFIGHTFIEVLAGFILGATVATAICF
jgi:acid phosphatase family membrane protein YuiD